jgi:tetratricopeptide (TPR) repeat protein
LGYRHDRESPVGIPAFEMGYKGLRRAFRGQRPWYTQARLFMNPQLQASAERVCRSETFRSSPRLQELLRYLVKRQTEEGQAKETLVGVEFFRRNPEYDPRKDPIVRVEAHRLRRRLREYFQREGAELPWRIELPPGAYVPVLRRRDDADLELRLAVRVSAPDPLTAEGMTSELIRQLGGLRGVKVLAPLSSLKAESPMDAVQLGANSVLECRLDGLSLRATLSRVHGGRLTSIGSFDNLIQPAVEALTHFVASSMGVRRAGGSPMRAPLDLESYQLYLAGRAWFHRWSPGNLIQAANCFEQVIEREPGFAPAYAALADIQILRAYWYASEARPVLERGLAHALKAAELDPECGDAHCSRGALEAVLHHNWHQSEDLFRMALEMNSNSALALNWLAIIILVPQQRFGEAVDSVFAAYDLDPASPEIGNEIVWVRICCGQYAEAASQARRIVELHAGFLEAYWSWAVAESSCGEHAAASEALDRADRLNPDIPVTLALRCFVEGARGNVEAAQRSLARLDSIEDPSAARAIYRAWAYAAIGERDRGMEYLERAVDVADPHALYVDVFPPNAALRDHPRYPEILRRQKLPGAHAAVAV